MLSMCCSRVEKQTERETDKQIHKKGRNLGEQKKRVYKQKRGTDLKQRRNIETLQRELEKEKMKESKVIMNS